MAIDDNTLYGLTGAQIKELPEKIDAVKGMAKVLTADDYNYPANNPTSVALWLLPAGIYTKTDSSVSVRSSSWSGSDRGVGTFILMPHSGQDQTTIVAVEENIPKEISIYYVKSSDGTDPTQGGYVVRTTDVVNALNSYYNVRPLSANQGRVLNEKIEGRIVTNAGAPTTSTVGTVGQILEDTTNGKLYICTDATNPYVWEEVGSGGGGGGVSDVQVNGTSVVSGGVANIGYAGLNTGGVVRVNPSYGINTASTGTLIGVTKDYTNYTSGSDLTLIDKGTLENVIAGKGLVDQTALAGKQDTLTPGSNITISNGTISATDTTYTAGSGISISNNQISASNNGTITGVSANGTNVATSGVADIPAATTSAYGVTQLSDSTSSTSTALAATANAVKTAYDLADGKASITLSTTDIGEGVSLAANTLYGVYE